MFAASKLANAGLNVVLLEAGAEKDGNRAGLLGTASNPGKHLGLQDGWTTGLGGTTQLWGGQLWPWRAEEFAARPDVGIHAWPVASAGVMDEYSSVRGVLGLSDTHRRIHENDRLPRRLQNEVGGAFDVRFSTWMSWGERNFARNPSLRNLRVDRDNLTIATGAIVHGVESKPNGFSVVRYIDCAGQSSQVNARNVILAAGTLGNVRLLTNSSAHLSMPALGKGFMDHVSARYATYRVSNWPKFRAFASHRRWRGVLASPRLVPKDSFLREEAILPAYGHWEFELGEMSAPSKLRGYLRSRQAGTKDVSLLAVTQSVARNAPDLIEALGASLITHQRPIPRSSIAHLRIDVQQPTRQDSAIAWALDSNPQFDPTVRLDWSIGEEEVRAVKVVGANLAEQLSKNDIGAQLIGIEPSISLQDTFHLMGGTRMGQSSAHGVVDPNLSVFGLPGVFVAGASVFPSGGMANPTYTALALASRLVDHIIERT